MATFEHESSKERLELFIRNEVLPKLKSLIDQQAEQFVEFLMENCKLLKVIKDQHLEESNSFEDGKLFYLYQGIAQSCHYTPFNNKLNVSRIWTKDEVIFDSNSLHNKQDRDESIQMLEDGELLCISYSKLKIFLTLFPNMIAFFLRIQTEREVHSKFYQILLKLSVKERVKLFIDRYPGIMARINNDYIALYLGIARGRLSKAYNSLKNDKTSENDL